MRAAKVWSDDPGRRQPPSEFRIWVMDHRVRFLFGPQVQTGSPLDLPRGNTRKAESDVSPVKDHPGFSEEQMLFFSSWRDHGGYVYSGT